MANITQVDLLNCPLENDYKNTFYFADLNAQQSYFAAHVVKTYSNFSYQRKDHIIRIPEHIDDLYNCNYVRYKNTDYSSKWFYAFIIDMKYIDDNRTDVYIETDCMQTWLFDYTVFASFVEREHVNDDTKGLHTIDEGLQLGEFVCNAHYKANFTGNYAVVVGVTADPDTGNGVSGQFYNGIYSGIKYYVFPGDSSGISAIQTFLGKYAQMGKSDAVICMFLAPQKIVALANNNVVAGTSLTAKLFINQSNTQSDSNTPVVFVDNAIDGYVPKNNKVLTYPYHYLHVSNNCGGDVVYKFEDWFTRNHGAKTYLPQPLFVIEGALTPGCSVRMIPMNYKGDARNDSEGINMGKFPALNWTSDYFTNWLTQNAVNIGVSVVSGAASVVGGAALAATGVGAGVGGGSIMGGLGSIAGTLGEVYKASIVPPQSNGNINAGDIVTASGQNDFHFYDMSIKYEYAKIIDDYFSMFGYKVNTVKIPNKNHRANYWFTKTIDVNIDGAIPNKDLQTIKDCYNRGVRFWKNTNMLFTGINAITG